MALMALIVWYLQRSEKSVYLLDFSTFEPPDNWKLTSDQLMEIMRRQGVFSEESLTFLQRMLAQSGVGPKTAWPPGATRCLKGFPLDRSADAARKESEVTLLLYSFASIHRIK